MLLIFTDPPLLQAVHHPPIRPLQVLPLPLLKKNLENHHQKNISNNNKNLHLQLHQFLH